MRFESIVTCVIFAVLTTTQGRVSVPQLTRLSTKSSTPVIAIKKLPEERRQLSIFPKNMRKFTILPMSYYKIHTTENPKIKSNTVKPLMRKFVLQDKRYDVHKIMEKRVMKRPMVNRNLGFAKKLDAFRLNAPNEKISDQTYKQQKIGHNNTDESNYDWHGDTKPYTTQTNIITKKNNDLQTTTYNPNARYKPEDIQPLLEQGSVDVTNDIKQNLTPKLVTSPEFDQNINIENCMNSSEETTKESELNSLKFTIGLTPESTSLTKEESDHELDETTPKLKYTEEDVYGIDFTTTEVKRRNDNIQYDLKQNLLLPDIKSSESNTESIMSDEYIQSIDRYSQDEIADYNEFIFLNETNNISKIENSEIYIPEDKDITTEIFMEPKIRKKRSINIIEEEHLASTVSGFKVTDKDMRTSDNVIFRNINS